MGFFRDFKEDMTPEETKGNKRAESEEDSNMSEFEDANVDQDLLSQIFGEDSDEESKAEGDSPAEDQEDSVSVETADALSAEGKEEDSDLSVEDILKAAAGEENEPGQERKASASVELPAEPDTDVTIITKGTTINGGVSSSGSLEIMGTITGDVECRGKLSVFGLISGNVNASDVEVDTKRLEGNIQSEGSVSVATGTVIIGDITGTSASIAGAVKGNIDVNGPVTVDSTAIVKGSIKAKSIQVNTGAVVDGYCSLNYAGVDLEDFFEEK